MTASVCCLTLCFHYHTVFLITSVVLPTPVDRYIIWRKTVYYTEWHLFFAFFFFGILRQNSHSMVQTGIQLVEVLLLQAPDLTNL